METEKKNKTQCIKTKETQRSWPSKERVQEKVQKRFPLSIVTEVSSDSCSPEKKASKNGSTNLHIPPEKDEKGKISHGN